MSNYVFLTFLSYSLAVIESQSGLASLDVDFGTVFRHCLVMHKGHSTEDSDVEFSCNVYGAYEFTFFSAAAFP